MKIVQLPSRGPISDLRETAPEFMRHRPSVLFFPVYKKTNSKGLCPVYCRITYLGARAEFSTGITVSKNDFSNGSLVITAPGFDHKNNELLYIESKLQEIYLHLRIKQEPFTAEKIKKIFLEPPRSVPSFYELVCEYVKNKRDKLPPGGSTESSYRVRLVNITEYFKKRNLLKAAPTDITTETIQDFENWMRGKGLAYVYINRHIAQVFNNTIKKAISKGILTYNVLSGYEYSHDPPKSIISLTKQELTLLEKKRFVSDKLQRVADLYIFCCYTSFAYCDLAEFNFKKHTRIIAGKRWIDKNRQKSHVEQITPLFAKAQEILKKYNYFLPVITLQKYNDYIKEVADILGIEKHLTTHTARKTFAMIRIEEGYTFDATAKMMGHKSSKQTENTYGKVTHTRIALEMKKKAA